MVLSAVIISFFKNVLLCLLKNKIVEFDVFCMVLSSFLKSFISRLRRKMSEEERRLIEVPENGEA